MAIEPANTPSPWRGLFNNNAQRLHKLYAQRAQIPAHAHPPMGIDMGVCVQLVQTLGCAAWAVRVTQEENDDEDSNTVRPYLVHRESGDPCLAAVEGGSVSNPQLKIGSDVCRCGACGKHFSSTFAFDKHRTGPAHDRRCRTIDEMLAKGMGVNSHGRWVSAIRDANLESTIDPWPIGDGPNQCEVQP